MSQNIGPLKSLSAWHCAEWLHSLAAVRRVTNQRNMKWKPQASRQKDLTCNCVDSGLLQSNFPNLQSNLNRCVNGPKWLVDGWLTSIAVPATEQGTDTTRLKHSHTDTLCASEMYLFYHFSSQRKQVVARTFASSQYHLVWFIASGSGSSAIIFNRPVFYLHQMIVLTTAKD